MPNTYKHLKDKILDPENILTAWKKVRNGHSKTSSVIKYEENLWTNLLLLIKRLDMQMWKSGTFREFVIHEPKERKVSAPDIESRIVHHAWCNICEPLFNKKFIEHSYACRKGKGMHSACIDLQKSMRKLPRKESWYALRVDFRKYFHSIPHSTIKGAVRKTIRDPWALWVIDTIIDGYPQGLPIGSLTSQLMANVVLDRLDQFVTCNLGVSNYGRYMDDIYVLGTDKNILENILETMNTYATRMLGLELNSMKSYVCCIKLEDHRCIPFDFCGYRCLPYKLLPRKSTVKRASKRIKKVTWRVVNGVASKETLNAQVSSYHGYIMHASLDGYSRKIQNLVIHEAMSLL